MDNTNNNETINPLDDSSAPDDDCDGAGDCIEAHRQDGSGKVVEEEPPDNDKVFVTKSNDPPRQHQKQQEKQDQEKDDGQSDDGEHICRFCFDGEDEEDDKEETKSPSSLITPCRCKGGQKYIHLSCLRRWQRMVLVSQPTHPDFWEDDVRHTTCNVCKSKFTCPPPTREELMLGFTGPEIAALIQPGCIIASHESFNRTIDQQMRRNPFFAQLSGAEHWFRGVYLIANVEEGNGDDKTFEWPINDEADVQALFQRLNIPTDTEAATTASTTGNDGRSLDGEGIQLPFLETADRSIKYVLEPSRGILEGRTDFGGREDNQRITEACLKKFLLSNLPCQLVFRRTTTGGQADEDELAGSNLSNFKDDKVSAVNLSRPFKPSGRLKERVEKVIEETKTSQNVRVKYYKGGPCEDDRIVTSLVLGGRRRGYTVVKSFRTALLMARRNAMQAVKHDKGQYIAVGQQVIVERLWKRPDLNGSCGFVQAYDQKQGRFEVRLLSQPSQHDTITCNNNTCVDNKDDDGINPTATTSTEKVVEPQQQQQQQQKQKHQERQRGGSVVVKVKPSNLCHDDEDVRRNQQTPSQPDQGQGYGTIMAFAGDARWTRVQLLGEIAKTSWGLCQGQISDVLFSPSENLYDTLSERLVYAPMSEMSRQIDEHDDDGHVDDNGGNDLTVLRSVAIEVDRYVRREEEREESDSSS